jgi:DNA-directed RNA polymerase subunit RPC12/RpoP
MPTRTDSDLNKHEDRTIIWSCNVDCPRCGTTVEAMFDTGKRDQDELVTEIKCPNCDESYEAEYTGWVNYGDAG